MHENRQKSVNIKQILGITIVAVLAAAGAYVGINRSSDTTDKTTQTTQTTQVVTSKVTFTNAGKTVAYDGVEGKTALELLKQYVDKVETKTFSGIGEYVVTIKNVAAQENVTYWSFYVNGKSAEVGAGAYTAKAGDKIEWRLENVSAYIE